ncbi:hypothetical protein [Streptomyces sp. NPDC002540]
MPDRAADAPSVIPVVRRGCRGSPRIHRRERVLTALDALLRNSQDITVAGLARAARIEHTFPYWHFRR